MILIKWQHKVLKNAFPFLWPLFIALAILFTLFFIEIQNQEKYVNSYRSQIEEKLKAPAVKRDSSLRAQIKYEYQALKSGPDAYNRKYLEALSIRRNNNGTSSLGTRIKNAFTPISIDITNMYTSGEYQNTINELNLVASNKLTPFFPARLLTNESTKLTFGGDDLTFKKYTMQFSTRFYTHGFYFLEHLFHELVFNVLSIIFGLVILGWWSQIGFKKSSGCGNDWLEMLNISQEKAYLGGFLLNILSYFVMTLVITAVFLLISAAFASLGSLEYPIFDWNGNFMQLWQIVLTDISLLMINIFLFFSISSLLQTLISNALVQTLVSSIIVVLASLLPIRWWSPFASLHISMISDGFIFQNGGSLLSVILITLSLGIMFLFSGLLVIKLQRR